MSFFYSAATMGYGQGRLWHNFFNFPNFNRATKTLTLFPKKWHPYAIFKWDSTVYNKISWHNIGIKKMDRKIF